MRKRLFSVMLCLCLAAGVLSGCGDEDDKPVSGSAVESSESDEKESTNILQSLLGGEPTPEPTPTSEPTPEPTPEPFIQVGTQIDGGDFLGLNWVVTDAGELIISGHLESANVYEEVPGDNRPWYTYHETITQACLTCTGMQSMSGIFGNCSSLTSVDLSGLDTSNVTRMSSMFYGCSSLTSVDLSSFDTSNVTRMSSMFYGCSSLTSVDLSSFDTSNVRSMEDMFKGCSSLISVDLSSFDTSNVEYIGGMFYDCRNIRTLDLSNFNTRNVESMKLMFSGCPSLQEILVGDDWLLAPEYEDMFLDCGVDHVTYK